MSPSALPQTGAYPLLGVGKLANVTSVFPGEVWSNKTADGIIIPGTCVKEVWKEGQGLWAPVLSTDTVHKSGEENEEAHPRVETLGVAMRQIMVPDVNPGSQYNPQLGPNEIMNLPIASGDWMRVYRTGVLNLTLVQPQNAYKEGDIIGWAPKADRPAEKAEGFGAWSKLGTEPENSKAEATPVLAGTDIFVVHDTPQFYGEAGECVLTVRFLRSNN
jgi:hypothetical protein